MLSLPTNHRPPQKSPDQSQKILISQSCELCARQDLLLLLHYPAGWDTGSVLGSVPGSWFDFGALGSLIWFSV